MMYITEAEVKTHLPVYECIEVLHEAFSKRIVNIPRYRLKSDNSLLHVMSASIPELGIIGGKVYCTARESATFVVLLWDETTGSLLAVVEGDALGQIRTGAASGLATDLLANADAQTGAVIGAGFQAETQLLAIDAVRTFGEIRIYSRRPENVISFIERMQPRVRARLKAAASSEAAALEADVICTITSSKQPVLLDQWVKPGCHINAAGGNWAQKNELESEIFKRAALVCVDNREQAKIESGEIISAENAGYLQWEQVHELTDIVQGKQARTHSSDITIFKSNGIAAEDIASARYLHNKLSGLKV